jgi:hypothetical protein
MRYKPSEIKYIECYPPSLGDVSYSLVTFKWEKGKASDPQWEILTLEDVNTLLKDECLSI